MTEADRHHTEIEVRATSLYVGQETVYERSEISEQEVLSFIEQGSAGKVAVILEGPPLYLWPHPDLPTQTWHHPSVRNGWRIVDTLEGVIPHDVLHHMVLIDDFNNIEGEVTEEIIAERLAALRETVNEIGSSSVFSDRPFQVRRHRESDFVRDDRESTCSYLDAGFQRQKLLLQHKAAEEQGVSLSETLSIVIHPHTFQRQQSAMLGHLLGEMKRPPFDSIPKKDRRRYIEDTYRHVWLDDGGRVDSVTRPIWEGNKFVHTRLR